MDMKKYVNVLMLTGREAIVVPCLAFIGAAGIIGVTGYGAYKLGKKAYSMLVDNGEVFDDKVKERVQEYEENS